MNIKKEIEKLFNIIISEMDSDDWVDLHKIKLQINILKNHTNTLNSEEPLINIITKIL